MKMSVAFKPLIVAAALAVTGGAAAVTPVPSYTLPEGSPLTFGVSGSSFVDSFTFSVSKLSSLSGGVGSNALNFGSFSLPAVTFTELSLTGPGLSQVSLLPTMLPTNSATFGASALSVGDYTLTVKGSASGFGVYSLYGNLAPVPEPASYAMFLAGLGIIGVVANRRRKSI